jgi:hypothetical protein
LAVQRDFSGKMRPYPEKECGKLLFDMALMRLQVFPKTRQVPHRLLFRSGNPHGSEFSGPMKPGQCLGVPPVGLDPVARLLGDQGGRHNAAFVSCFQELSMHGIATGPGFVDKGEACSIFGKLFRQFHDSIQSVGDVAVEAHLTASGVGDGNGNAVLVYVKSDEFGIMGHGLSSCILALDCE